MWWLCDSFGCDCGSDIAVLNGVLVGIHIVVVVMVLVGLVMMEIVVVVLIFPIEVMVRIMKLVIFLWFAWLELSVLQEVLF